MQRENLPTTVWHLDYEDISRILSSLIQGESDSIANTANAAALLYQSLPDINWVGFYFARNDELVLGPFQGKPACIRIPFGKGVCGTSARLEKSILVTDVHDFPGHIACDPASRSELVVPILQSSRIVGVLDVDSPTLARFSSVDQLGLEEFVRVLTDGTDFSAVTTLYDEGIRREKIR